MGMDTAIAKATVALFAPLVAFAVLALVPALRRQGRAAAAIAILAATVSSVLAVLLALRQIGTPVAAETVLVPWLQAGGQTVASLGIHVDGASSAMLAVVACIALFVQVFSLGYLHDEPPDALGRYFTWHSLFLFAMSVLVVAPDVLQLFLGWELVGLASYLLIGFWFRKPEAGRAALKAFWVTKLADIGLGAGLVALYVKTHSFGWDPQTVQALGPEGATLVAGLFFVAVMGKSAQFPLHVWLPDAMEGPTPVSALLHAATMVAAGVYLVVRAFPIFAAAPDVLQVMAWLGAFTAVFAACCACVQDDIKKVLAYSTCSQLGFMVAGLGAGSVTAGWFHLVTHAAFKALLFLAAGALIHAVHSNKLGDMGGLWKKLPLSATAWLIGAAALAGVPGLAGFFSKDAILEALHDQGLVLPWLTCLAAAGLTAFYATRTSARALFGPPSDAAAHAHEAPWSMRLPLLILAVLAAGAGYAGGHLGALVGGPPASAWHAFHLSTSALAAMAMAGLGIAAAVILHLRGGSQAPIAALAPVARFIAGAAVDRAALATYRHGFVRISGGVAWFDRYIIDGAINGVAWLALASGDKLRAVQTGRPLDYLYAVAAGLLLLAAAGAMNP